MKKEFVAVVGGVNVDITGSSFAPLIAGDSNPGAVKTTFGGVGRNIAENLSRLGHDVLFVTVLGGDEAAKGIGAHLRELGIRLEAVTLPQERCSTYLCINGTDGNVAAAIADMAILDRFTPELLLNFLPELNRAKAVIAEANLPAESLHFLSDNLQVPLYCDPVSVSKAPKLKGALAGVAAIKPNREEAAVLTGQRAESPEELTSAAARLRSMGVQRVFLSLGSEGVYADDGETRFRMACLPGKIVNTTGCGDAFFAAAADGLMRGLSLWDCTRQGLAASALCAECAEAVCPDLSRDKLRMKMAEGKAAEE